MDILPARRRRQRVQDDDPGDDQADAEIGKAIERLTECHSTEERYACNAALRPDRIGNSDRHGVHYKRHYVKRQSETDQGKTSESDFGEAVRLLERCNCKNFDCDPYR